MNPTRKLAIGFALLLGLLSVLWAYDAVQGGKYDEATRQELGRKKAELDAIDREGPSAAKLYAGENRTAHVDMLRASTSHPEDLEMSRRHTRGGWIKSAGALSIALALLAFVIVSGRKEQPQWIARATKVRPLTIVACLLALVALCAFVGVGGGILERRDDLARAEQRAVETQQKLKSFAFDANGNIDPARRGDFEMAMSSAKYIPAEIASSKENLMIGYAMLAGALVAFLGFSVIAFRSAKKRDASPTAPHQMMRAA